MCQLLLVLDVFWNGMNLNDNVAADKRKKNRFIFTRVILFNSKFTCDLPFVKVFLCLEFLGFKTSEKK